jgi:hypothetical protein
MKAIAFFSYKGGVGRTLAAANFAVYLAKLGLKVVIMDFDLDAPGVDSKFPSFPLPKGQLGLIDYILGFQRDGSPPGPLKEIYSEIRITSGRQPCALGLIPAGDYLAPEYPSKLNELDWSLIFSDKRDGVAYFQLFLDRIKQELSPDVLVIDSRTGFTEIGGLCTQQLADETVMLSSMANESIKMTRHLAKVIRESEISKQLHKSVETKVVVCRVPRPRDIEKLKARCCKEFEVEPTKLFFLFSSPGLEEEEFVAMLDTKRDDTLVSNYLQLFKGLDVEMAEVSIREEIERTEKGLLSCTPAEAESRIRDMVALYPHPEVYRRAMRFFNLTRRSEEAAIFGIHLLDLVPADVEAQLQATRFLLEGNIHFHQGTIVARRRVLTRQLMEVADVDRWISIAWSAWGTGQLSMKEKVKLAQKLEEMEGDLYANFIAKACLDSGAIDDSDLRIEAMEVAARTAMKLGNKDEAAKLLTDIPIGRLQGKPAALAIEFKIEAGGKKEAFELARTILKRNLDPWVVDIAIKLAHELGRVKEIEDLIRHHPEVRRGDPQVISMLEHYGMDVSGLWGVKTRWMSSGIGSFGHGGRIVPDQ